MYKKAKYCCSPLDLLFSIAEGNLLYAPTGHQN